MAREQLLQYNIAYDKREADPIFIVTQLKTHLKERFNVLLSTAEYSIVDGHLTRRGTDEPFISSIIRGRDLVRRLAPTPVDFDREDAEVEGFGQVIDPFFSNLQTPLGSKVLSISPRGEERSKYQHNFYDIFTLKTKDGQRYVEMRRYSSALTPPDYARILPGLNPDNPPTATEFLRKPIKITDIFATAEQIHGALHKRHDYMEEARFEEIWEGVQPAVANYLTNRDANSFNAILNLADRVAFTDYVNRFPTRAELISLGNQKVRQTVGPCPGKSGAEDENSPFSVSEFDNKHWDYHTGDCVVCNSKNVEVGPCNICRECEQEFDKEL
ncbi:hypothetical protein HYW66_00055 [Candidatus Microgenomates bacterium]|nr:hypothetical protein [Candidatus Microgenomates bacterium]